jgi:hypothetical protein
LIGDCTLSSCFIDSLVAIIIQRGTGFSLPIHYREVH